MHSHPHTRTCVVTCITCSTNRVPVEAVKHSRAERVAKNVLRTRVVQALSTICFVIAVWCALSLPSIIATKLPTPTTILIVSLPWRDHIVPLRVLSTQLVAKGHVVRFAVPNEAVEWVTQEGVEVIDIGSCDHIRRQKESLPPAVQHLNATTSHPPNLLHNLTSPLHRGTGLPALLTTLHAYADAMYEPLYEYVEAEQPGIMIVDRFAWAGSQVARHLNVTYIVNNPNLLFDLSSHPAWYPSPLSYLTSTPLTLYERMVNILHRLAVRVEMKEPEKKVQKVISSDPLSYSVPPLMLTNTVFGIELPRPLPPHHRLIGPLVPPEPELLDERLQDWLDACIRSKKIVIVVALGEDSSVEEPQVSQLLNGLNHAEIRVLWVMSKARRDILLPEVLPSWIRWASDIPAYTVFAHESVALLISHGGVTNVQEGLYYGKPVLLIPSYVDEFEVSHRIVTLGAGLMIQPHVLTTERVIGAIHELRYNESYATAASYMKSFLRSSGGIQEAISLIELTHRIGTSHLHPLGLPSHRTPYLLDVYAVYCTILGTLALVVKSCWSGIQAVWRN